MAHWLYIVRTEEFETWLATETPKVKALVEARIFRIEVHNHFGDAKHLGAGLSELRWANGLRVYFARIGNKVLLLINGGRKNDQKSGIKKARILLNRYSNSQT